jgi:hypothetical protein
MLLSGLTMKKVFIFLLKECGDYETLVNVLYNEYGVKETGDGVRFADPRVNVIQLNSDVFDF